MDDKIRQKIRKLCEGDADEFIRWNKQLDTMIKDKSCDTAKYNFVMVAAMLYGYISDTWSKHVTSVTRNIRNKKCTDEKSNEVKEKC